MKKYIYFYFLLILIFLCPKSTNYTSAAQLCQIDNAVVLVEFADDDNYFDKNLRSLLDYAYNGIGEFDVSAANYFKEVSNNKFKFKGVFANYLGGKKCVKLKNPRSYYLPQTYSDNTPTNIDGAYDNHYYKDEKLCDKQDVGAKKHIDSFIRESLMIREIILNIASFEKGANLDFDGDGAIDNITFILSNNVFFNGKNIWGELLWPHMARVEKISKQELLDRYFCPENYLNKSKYDLDEFDSDIYLYGKRVESYNILSAAYLFNTNSHTYNLSDRAHTGVICHEVMHTLGVMDYYPYDRQKAYLPVGKFDLMASTSKNPQYLLTFLRLKLGWLDDDQIVSIDKSQTCTLFPTSSHQKVKALKIKPKCFETDEYFMIEARSDKFGMFDKIIGGTGIIIYRIDPAAAVKNNNCGNMYGEDEIYIFRRYDKDKCQYLPKADSGFLQSGESFGSLKRDNNIECLFYQGTDNAKLAQKNAMIAINNICVNDNYSVTFDVQIA